MAIITHGTVVRGTPSVFTLSKSQLLLNSIVAANSNFANSANWKKVHLYYYSNNLESRQSQHLIFNAALTTPIATFSISSLSLGDFLISKLTIEDNDGGFLIVSRANLTTSEFDVIFLP